jgi:hypothetical protein
MGTNVEEVDSNSVVEAALEVTQADPDSKMEEDLTATLAPEPMECSANR